jgi:hypothetical protein
MRISQSHEALLLLFVFANLIHFLILQENLGRADAIQIAAVKRCFSVRLHRQGFGALRTAPSRKPCYLARLLFAVTARAIDRRGKPTLSLGSARRVLLTTCSSGSRPWYRADQCIWPAASVCGPRCRQSNWTLQRLDVSAL